MPVVDTNTKYTYVDGLSPKENRKFNDVLNPSNSIGPQSRIEDNGVLQIQADSFEEALNETTEQQDQTENTVESSKLEGRITGLRNARDRILEQRQLEETRAEQENDISRLQKFKELTKENLVGVSALAISIGAIITTIIVGTRKALVKGAQATGKFSNAVYNLGKELGSLQAPLLNIISEAIALGAKGLAWSANNLWLPALALAWFIYDQYKQRRKK